MRECRVNIAEGANSLAVGKQECLVRTMYLGDGSE
jgi:hypothetical protein